MASALPVLCLVPVIRVFMFTRVSLPLSFPNPLPLVLLVFAVTIPPSVLSPSWKLTRIIYMLP